MVSCRCLCCWGERGCFRVQGAVGVAVGLPIGRVLVDCYRSHCGWDVCNSTWMLGRLQQLYLVDSKESVQDVGNVRKLVGYEKQEGEVEEGTFLGNIATSSVDPTTASSAFRLYLHLEA